MKICRNSNKLQDILRKVDSEVLRSIATFIEESSRETYVTLFGVLYAERDKFVDYFIVTTGGFLLG